jgi:hypothetical protein
VSSTAPSLRVSLTQPLFAESTPFLAGVCPSVRRQMPLIGALIRQFAQQRHHQLLAPVRQTGRGDDAPFVVSRL